jgi:arylsulfatase A-like enzyme
MRLSLLILCFVVGPATVCADERPRKPNVIVVLADDLGYSDISLHGARDVATPFIDSIAKNGVRCTSGYVSAPYCSPTRAGLLTGRYQQRFGHEFNPALVKHGGMGQGLSVEERTFADWLRAAGYVTGLIGKWHLGEDEFLQPQRRGFDEFYGFLAGAHSYFETEDKNYGPLLRCAKGAKTLTPAPLPEGEEKYLTRVLAEEACGFIQRNRERPFFLYLAFNAVHTPMHAPEKTEAAFAGESDPTRRTYLAMVKELDNAVGKVLARVRELNLEEDTLIFFLSDNGGPTTKFAPNGSRNGPLRGSKGDTWEGGIRVPFLVQWKGKFPAGKTLPQPVISLDILPTALAAAGHAPKTEKRFDGVNLLPILHTPLTPAPLPAGEGLKKRALFWRFGTQMAIRKGDWVLVRPSMGKKEYEAIAEKAMLFNLEKDIGQQKDLASQQPELVRSLQAEWDRWNAEMAKPRWPATLRGAVFTMP